MIDVALIGGTGYTGMELARLLTTHPKMRLTIATSREEAGKKLGDIMPFLRSYPIADIELIEPDAEKIAKNCEIAFLAVPHTVAAKSAKTLLEHGCKVVDLSADFRLHDPQTYEEWYKVSHDCPELLPQAAYGLPELYADKIAKTSLLANPGCYPSSVILALAPLLEKGLIEHQGIVIDAKSGTTGAGRKASVPTLFCEVHDAFRPYNLGKHRHTPEIEQELGLIAQKELFVSFNPHLLPIGRGILSTIYTQLSQPLDEKAVHDLYKEFYASVYANKLLMMERPWVRILPLGELPNTQHVRGTMFCDIGLTVDKRTNRLIVTSAIDNLSRGASAQALANANLMSGLPVDTGLQAPAVIL